MTDFVTKHRENLHLAVLGDERVVQHDTLGLPKA